MKYFIVKNWIKKITSENDKIVFKNVSGAFLIRGIHMVVSLLLMPMYIRFFNNQVTLGLWFTILSVLTWILTFDLGVGNGLRNLLTEALSLKMFDDAKKYVSTAYFSIGLFCVLLIIIFLLISNRIDWNVFFNIGTDVVSPKSLLNCISIIFVGLILHLLLKLVSSIFFAIQKSALNNFIALITSVIMLLGLLFVPSSQSNDENIVVMAWIHILAVILPLLIATMYLFFFSKLKILRPSLKNLNLRLSKKVLSLGGVFFYVQLIYIFIMSTNEYMITYFTDNANVVEYRIYNTIFTFGSSLFVLAMTPIWSVVTKALAEKNFIWVNKLYNRLIVLAALGSVCEFIVIVFLQKIVNVWLQSNAIMVNCIYAIAFASVASLMIFNSVLSCIANGSGELKTQVLFFTIGALLKIPVAMLLANQIGWIGIVVANAVALSFYCIVQPFWLKKFLREKKKCAENLV